AVNVAPTGLAQVPLPPGAHRSLAIREERGGAMIGFYGSGDPQEWMRFFDGWFAEREWSVDGWLAGSKVWSARFRSPDGDEHGHVEIQLAEDYHELTGLIQVVQ